MDELLRKILTSKVYEAAVETPLEEATGLSARMHNRILLKREDKQPVFSFKIRGAYNRIAHLDVEQKKCGVLAASAGNHAQGVAFASRRLGIRALIVMVMYTFCEYSLVRFLRRCFFHAFRLRFFKPAGRYFLHCRSVPVI